LVILDDTILARSRCGTIRENGSAAAKTAGSISKSKLVGKIRSGRRSSLRFGRTDVLGELSFERDEILRAGQDEGRKRRCPFVYDVTRLLTVEEDILTDRERKQIRP
jgi:hypothetical protein